MTTTSNQITEENQKPGTPESVWGLADGPSDNIEGFSTSISVNVGDEVDFKINTDSTHYRIEIYRLGYYDGDGARLVGTIEHQSATPDAQPDPMVDLNTGLVDAGNWHVTDSFQLPADAISGVYIAKLVREDGVEGENHIPFVVRDDSSHSDIVFQTADETWQAYNDWGGSSLYTSDIVSPAATAVSYNRPLDTYLLNGSIFGQEYAAIRWLEENGYDVTYQSGVDTARDGDLLLNHKVFMDAGHDEYWSGAQRDNVEAARDAGVNLAFLTGNEMFWKTRFDSGADGASDRTLITYKEPYGGTDPSDEWTGMWRSVDTPGGADPENGLTGTLFIAQDAVTDINVPYEYSNFRFWNNTSIADLKPGETGTLSGLLGYEWDTDADNGYRPAGLINLSSTTVNVTEGVQLGQLTHSLNLYRAESGALVFGAGTVFWSWGLDSHHSDYSNVYGSAPQYWDPVPGTNTDVQQAMVNLLAEMGVQPTTLQPQLVPGSQSLDTQAPTSTFTTPDSAPKLGQEFLLSGTSVDQGGGLVAGNEISTDGGLTWHKASGFTDWTYTWVPDHMGLTTIEVRATDDSLNLATPTSIDLWVANEVNVAENTVDVTVVADTSLQLDMLNLAHGVCAFCGGSDPALTGGVGGVDILTLALTGPDAALFTIDESTGALSFITPPDFELPSDANGDNAYEVTVERSAGSFHDSIPLVVNITNVGPETAYGTDLNDKFFAAGDKSSFFGGGGNDTVSYALASQGVTASLQPSASSIGGRASTSSTTDKFNSIENLIGSNFNDSLTGDTGSNVLEGGRGADKLDGSSGSDTASYEHATSAVTASLSNPKINTGDAAGDTYVSIENLIGSQFSDQLVGNTGSNILTGLAGDDWLDGGGGADRMIGGAGNDTYVVDSSGDVVDETGGDGIDTVLSSVSFSLFDTAHALGEIERLTLLGKSSINATGNGLGNILIGNTGNNILQGLAGADWLLGDSGTDTASYSWSSEGVNVSLATGFGSGGDAEGDQLFNIENLTGSNFDDTLEGNVGNNVLNGGLNSLAGDTVSYAHAASGANGLGVTASLATSSAQNTVIAGKDTLVGFENLTGSEFNDTLTGNSGNNVLTGLGGNDWLDGGAGADRMIGGVGDDTYVVDNAGDVVDETDGDGFDTVRSSIGFSLSGNALGVIENLTLVGKASINGTGNDLDNVLVGNTGKNILTGLGGDDWLDGSAGADWMLGGAGDDTYVVDNSGDVVDETNGDGVDTIQSSITFDLSDEAHALGEVERLTLLGKSSINATGNGLGNILVGNTGNNILQGLAGADWLLGDSGTDTASYSWSSEGVNVSLATGLGSGGDAEGDQLFNIENLTGSNFDDTLEGDAGNNVLNAGLNGPAGDTVSYAHAASVSSSVTGVGVTVSLATTTAQNTVIAGKDTLVGFENLTGSEFNDTLTGNSGNNVLTGLGGNDWLDGGAGADRMIGGAGDDTYVVDNLGDVVDETDGDGIDNVRSSISFNLSDAANALGAIEYLTLLGKSSINGTGNALGNIIFGNTGNNILEGLGGADWLLGDSGIDTASYLWSSDGVNVSLATGLGSGGDAEGDQLFNIENLTGSSFDDTLEGDGGNNVLTGGLQFLLGDTVSYAHAASGANGIGVTVSLAITSAQNTVTAGKDTLIGFENLTGSEFNDTLTGDAGNNILTGLGGNDWLDGAAGADRMVGGTGDDTYVVDNSSDVVDEADGSGLDTVRSSVSFSLSDPAHALGAIENLTLTGTSSVDGTGNELANVLTGNSANNILEGRGGGDWLLGDSGTDTASYTLSPAGVNVSLTTGLGFGGDAEGDQLYNIENLTGSSFDDTLEGNGGNNVLTGALNGAAGDTVSYAHAASGTNGIGVTVSLATASAQNTVTAGTDTLVGFENLTGSEFNDTLTGNSGNNVLTGLGGNDALIGGLGADTLTGGAGKDQFVYLSAAEGSDHIQDFTVTEDSLVFSASGFGGGLVARQQLVAGVSFVADAAPTAATNAGTFLFNTDTHDLLWDFDGLGAGDAVQIAHFDTAINLTINHFEITA